MARPKGAENKHKPFRAALNRLLDETGSNPKMLDDIALALALKARQGDVAAAQAIADRLDGKVPQAIGGDDDLGPIGVIVTGVPRDGD
jgi:hypothetical protein